MKDNFLKLVQTDIVIFIDEKLNHHMFENKYQRLIKKQNLKDMALYNINLSKLKRQQLISDTIKTLKILYGPSVNTIVSVFDLYDEDNNKINICETKKKKIRHKSNKKVYKNIDMTFKNKKLFLDTETINSLKHIKSKNCTNKNNKYENKIKVIKRKAKPKYKSKIRISLNDLYLNENIS